MTEKEKMYIKHFGAEYITLKKACQVWTKPGYSTLSKRLPTIGYPTAVDKGIIPKYTHIGNSYLFRIIDILNFLEERGK